MTFEDLHPRTKAFLKTAAENEQFASEILADDASSPVALRWATIALFYAAIHNVNAYFWERARMEPKHHGDREQLMSNWPDLVPLVADYMALKNHAWRARYAPGSQTPRDLAEHLHRPRFIRIKNTIRTILDA